MFERPPGKEVRERLVRLQAPDLETLLVRWINELAFLVQDSGFVPARADIKIQETGDKTFSLEARLGGVPLDLERYGWLGEIKSATFHGLDVMRGSEGWRARMILDV